MKSIPFSANLAVAHAQQCGAVLESVRPCGLSTWLREVRRFADTPLACEVENQASCLVSPAVCKSDAKAVDRLKDMECRPVQPSQEKTIQAAVRG